MTANDVVFVVGASGFGRECLDVLDAMVTAGAAVTVRGIVDDAPSVINIQRLKDRGVRYMGTIAEWLARPGNEQYILGIGDPGVRRKIVAALDGAGKVAATLVHPSANIGAETVLADGVVICAGVTVSTNVRLGRHVHLNPNATIGHDTILENFVSVNPGATVSGEVVIETTALVGAGAVVLQGLTVGAGAIVGASACVTHTVEAATTVVGVPARQFKKVVGQ